MRQVNSLNHTRWECKYHIVFIPKYRMRILAEAEHPFLPNVNTHSC